MRPRASNFSNTREITMSQVKPKRRDIHPETGLLFWCSYGDRDLWLTPEKFEDYNRKRREARRKNIAKKKLEPSYVDRKRPKIGDLDEATGLFYCYTSGVKQYWVTRDYLDAYKAKRLESARARKAADPEKYQRKYLEFAEKNKESERKRSREKMARKRAENKNDFKKKELRKKNARCKERAESDPVFAMKMRVLFSLNRAFKQNGLSKPESGSSHDLLGCTWETLKDHMESQFTNGMSWGNRGEWHVDHIIPLSTGKTIDEVKRLCHYSNLQPLWAVDNLKKGAKIL